MLIREIASISMGEGRNVTTENRGGHDFTGRLELLPFGEFKEEGDYSGSSLEREPTPKLALGLSFDYNVSASREGGQLGDYLEQKKDLRTLFADAMFKFRGWSVMAEYANKQTSGTPVTSRSVNNEVEQAFLPVRDSIYRRDIYSETILRLLQGIQQSHLKLSPKESQTSNIR